jgi:glycosyltransferase involved in cell wall biosynthesis
VRRAFRERGGPLTRPRRDALGIRDPYAVFVGNLETRKNIDVSLQAFELVRAVRPDAQLVLIGAPSIGWDGISAKHAALLDSGAVRAVGYLPDAEVTAIIRGAKVFVYPSRYEGFGIPPLEAMAAGTPVIATKIPSLEEALGPHARFVHPDDVDGLATAIADHFEGVALSGDIEGARGWAYEFTWGRSARTMLEVFAEAMRELTE